MRVREFNVTNDRPAVERCLRELQEFSRAHDPRMPAGSSISAEYMENLFRQCKKHDGKIFVAEQDEELVGYVCVLARVPRTEPADGVMEDAEVVDLVITRHAQGQGFGRSLLEAAEEFAISRGSRWLRVQVFAWNANARSLYGRMGFSEFEVVLEKELASLSSSGA